MTSVQHWDPNTYAHHGAFVPALGRPVVELLAPKSGELILDLGCGDGVLTQTILASGARVRGIDASPALVAAAVSKGVAARVLDAYDLAEVSEYDAVFSNATLHWLREPDRVLHGIHRALRPGGRFVGEFGGAGNTGLLSQQLMRALDARGHVGEAHNPWFFPDADEYAGLLHRAGFVAIHTELVARPTRLPGHLRDWLATFAQSFTAPLPESERRAYLEEVCAALQPLYCDAEGAWTVEYVRLRFSARKP